MEATRALAVIGPIPGIWASLRLAPFCRCQSWICTSSSPAGTKLNGGTYTVPAAPGNGLFHPFSDFLLHDVGTGDGIEIAVVEHFGRRYAHMQEHMSPTANRTRTAPLWGVRLRSRLMHDCESLTLRDAIERHRGEASDAHRRFSWLCEGDQEALLTFLRSL